LTSIAPFWLHDEAVGMAAGAMLLATSSCDQQAATTTKVRHSKFCGFGATVQIREPCPSI